MRQQLEAGDHLDQYLLVDVLARTVMATTFKGHDTEAGLPVCLKLPHLEYECDVVFYQRFLREESIALRLEHPNIVRGRQPRLKSRLYLVTDFVPGSSLRALIQKGPLSVESSLDIARQIAAAVAHLHANGIVHRDLKPENIIVTPVGEVKLIDFGLALDRSARRITWTKLPRPMGTPDYIAPEQISGRRGDERCDIYATGMILFEMLTGQLPFSGATPQSVLQAKANEAPLLPVYFRPTLGAGLNAIISQTIARHPHDRQRSMAVLLDQLRSPSEVQSAGDAERPTARPWIPRLTAILAVGALALLVWLSRPVKMTELTAPLSSRSTGSLTR